jgi:uncharacterized membrane-anchored protein
MAAKVPEVTVLFWVVKLLTTGMGEAASDFLGNLSIPLAGVVGVGSIVLTLRLQLRGDRYRAPVYWATVAAVAVFGTMAADVVHIAGVPYAFSTAFYAVVLAVVLTVWWRAEGTLSIHSITTRRRELFYWLTVLATFALGTAAGDLTADSLGLGFLGSGLLFAALFAVPALAWWRLGLNPVVAFWSAYVLTRPLGASFADWFGKPHWFGGGLGYGDGTVTGSALVVFIGLVAWMTVTRHGIQAPVVAATVESDAEAA